MSHLNSCTDFSFNHHRAEHEIYIGNYPVRFRENELRNLFKEHDITVKTIRMKHDGLKVWVFIPTVLKRDLIKVWTIFRFAFAETDTKEEIEKAVGKMDGLEINGRRLRVRSAGDKEPKNSNDLYVVMSQQVLLINRRSIFRKRPAKRDLQVSDVKRHLVYAFNGFLDREIGAEDCSEDKSKALQEVKEKLSMAFNLPDDDTLKVGHGHVAKMWD